MNFENLKQTDKTAYDLIISEMNRQETSLDIIPSECLASLSVIEALGSPLTNKYSEGYANRRYYGGNKIIDKVETLAIERAKKVFPGVAYVNVQPYSGSPANLAIYNALCNVGDTILGLSLSQGGHLTHGHKVSASSKFFNAIQYGLDENGLIDFKNVEELALKHKPKIIVVGFTAYPREFPFEKFREIADKVGAYLMADISHISGLVISGLHISPVPYCDVIMTTTHKTLKGPRGAMILTTELGINKDSDLAKKIDKSVFPGLQGGPHNHQTLAIAVALGEASKPKFKELNKQIILNAKTLASELIKYNFNVITGGTDTHLVLVGVGKGRGGFVQSALDKSGITLNKNTIPNDPCSAFLPSGIRMGTPIMTHRGMKESEVIKIAGWINEINELVKDFKYLETKEERIVLKKEFLKFIKDNDKIKEIRLKVKELCKNFPIYK